MVGLHLAEFQTPTRSCCPFRLSVIGKIAPPVLRGLRVLVVSLKQQREIELRISVFRRGVQRRAQTIDCSSDLPCPSSSALRRLQREQKPEQYVFMSERGAPMSAVAFRRMVTRLGPATKMPFGIHPHMLRHSTGFKLANQGVDTRSLQHYLGHKNIQHTVRYSELSPERFRDFWKD